MKRHRHHIVASLLAVSSLVGCSGEVKRPHANVLEVSHPEIIATAPDGLVAQSEESPFAKPMGKVVGSRRVSRACPTTIAADNVSLFIGSGAVSRDVEISVLATTEEHSGDIPDHLANLTADGAVYRMLPDGQQFDRDITIAMRYDSTALPFGYTADDIYTFFYNEEAGMWQQVERDSVDTQNQIVYSRTNHFTDYINGVLKVPESSDAMAYTPTSIKDLKAADPMEGITLMAPPEANNQGTVGLTYPLTIPAGRRGMQPQLAVTYNSAGGSGILGLGWSLPVSEISVETRWGVPLYDHTQETEGYVLDGITLVTAYRDDNNNLRLNKPVYHRTYEPRTTSDRTQFYPRVEGSFRKIERIGTSPDNYYWVVTDKDGTRHFYGQSNQAKLRDHNRNIAKWMLEKSVDTYGNTITYTYTTKYDYSFGQPFGRQICIDRIRYTGVDGSPDRGQYILRFKYADKHDQSNSFRYGLEEIDKYVLDRVEVMFRDTIVREYYFGYREGEFGKTLLCKIFEGYDDSARNQLYSVSRERKTIRDLSPYDRCGAVADDKNIFLHIFHSFDYYGLESNSLFAGAVIMGNNGSGSTTLFSKFDSVLIESSNFGGSGSLGWNVYGALNVGADYFAWLKSVSAGGHFSYGKDYADGLIQLVDINGDGYPDKLYKSVGGEVKCRPQLPGQNKFGAPQTITGIHGFQHTESSSQNYGWEASAVSRGTGKNWSDGRSTTSVYVSDVNGDGLIDIVNNGRVYINRGDYHFDDATDNDTIHVGGTCEGDVIDFSGEVDPTIFDDGYYTVEHIECTTRQTEIPILDTVYDENGNYDVIQNGWQMGLSYDTCWTVVDTFYYSYPKRYEPNVDLVRMWKAPYSGTVSITGTAKLTDELSDFRAETRTTDGVWASVQKAGETTTLASANILPDNSQSLSCQIPVSEGDTIFFRINAVTKRLYDQVEWTPHIEYLSASHRNNIAAFPLSRKDANGNYMYKFDYATDYMLTENQSVSIGSESGSACTNSFSVVCKIETTNPLSQAMTYSLVKSNIDNTGSEQVVNSTTFNQGTSPNTTLTWTAANVPSSKKLVLRLAPAGGGQLNWSDIEADATVTLTYSSDATINARLSDNDAREAYVYHPAVERVFYDYLVFPSSPLTGVAGSPSIKLNVVRNDGTVFNGSLYLTVKDYNNAACFRKNVTVSNGSAAIATSPFVFSSGTAYSVDCYVTDPAVADHISRIKVTVGGVQRDAGLYAKYGPDKEKHHGTLYRGWGQFGYKSPDSTSLCINSNYIHADSYYTDSNSVPRPDNNDIDNYDLSSLDEESSPEELPGSSMFNPLSGTFFEMHADAGNARWKSFANLVTASRTISSLDNTDPAVENGETATVDLCQSPLPVAVPGTKIKAVNKHVLNKGNGYTKKRQAYSKGHSRLLGDFMDLNGDRYPDNVSEKEIHYSRAQGGLGDMTRGYSANGGINRTENISSGRANNGTFLNTVLENVPNAKKSRAVSTVTSLFQLLNNDSTVSTDVTRNTFMDINGDGLADIVYSDGTVRYNMGYLFSNARTLPTATIRSSRSVARANGYGFNVLNTSISGSISRNKSNNATTFALMDVNGDGLPDKVSPSDIQINMGDGSFASYGSVGMDNSATTSFCLNITGTYDVVFPIFGFPLKVGGSAGGGGSASLCQSGAEFVDMNNDGYVDYVYRSGNSIKVRYSNIGRANLLKSVTNFANAEFQIDYELSTATTDCPHRHWNMTTLSVYDGHDGDGESTTYKSFDYRDRHYDRFERDDYGYVSVVTKDYESQADFASGTVYRTTVQNYYNDNYYRAHLKVRDCVSRGNAYVEALYTYADADLLDGHYLGGGTPAWCEGDGWPAVAREESRYCEGGSSVIVTRRDYRYGKYGNVVYVKDNGDISTTDDDYTVTLQYAHDPVRHIVSNVSLLDIPGYRHRTASYTPQGSLDKLTIDNNPNAPASYYYQYDQYGNIQEVITPATSAASGSQYWIRYKYDSVLHMFPTDVYNVEGYASSAQYSYRWQKPTNTYDISGNRMRYTYDSHGRTHAITAPKELAAGKPYTVRYDYWYSRTYDNPIYNTYIDATHGLPYYPWARTRNYDPQHPGNDINTVTFSDGLGRIIQVKKDVDVAGTEVRAVGGTVHYDGLGRKCKEFLLRQETDLQVFDMLLNVLSAQWQVQYDYDYLDRIVKTNYADGTYTTNTYSIAADAGGTYRFLNDATDQNGHTSHIFTDPRQLNMQFVDALGGTTKFRYDAIGQLASSVDPESNTTSHTYDFGGRRTDRTHPSAGHTHWDYDAAGNMVRQTQNSGEFINYVYNYSHPVRIEYSHRPWNNVWYEYGAAGSGNEAGRLISQQDATGVQLFKYDNMGNVEYNAHTYVQPHSHNTFTIETRWEYDSWGRVLGILYPDREDVRYSYDLGGNVCHIEGTKPGLAPTPYIDKLQYDLYEQRVYQLDGNGVESHYAYDPLNRRLAYMFDLSPTSGYLQSIKYTYDPVGNIKHISDGGYNNRDQYFAYDDINRLASSNGSMYCQGAGIGYKSDYSYSAAGRMVRKNVYSQRMSNTMGVHPVDYQNNYAYPTSGNVFAVKDVQEGITGNVTHLDWDANGNLVRSIGGGPFCERRLCWTEDNRMQGYWELSDENGGIAAYYNYAAGGDRNYKLTSPRINASQNAANIMQHPTLVYPTLYASSLITFNKGGYTKHYFEGANRVCSKIGGGFAAVSMSVVDSKVPYLSYDYTSQYSRQREGVGRTFIECLGVGVDVPNAVDLYDVIKHEQQRMEKEPAFYYHSDHLGSAAYLTNDAGQVTQTLNYLPYGEDWVDIQNYAETRYPRLGIYTYNGKEKDYESGFHYYGARYYWSEVLTGWLSVDPMADKYPSISPYAYCVWNPIILSDPDGDSVILSDDARIIHEKYYNVNKTYTDVYNQLNDPSNNTLFVFGKKGDTPNINNATEGGTVVEYFPPDEGVDPYENFAGDIYLVQWGEAHSELGGDESHVFLEEMYHAKQILDYGNNNGTIEKEVRAKEFAVKVNPYVIHSCKSNGYDNVPTQLSIIQGFNYSESSKFLKEGMHNVRVKNVWGGWEYGSIPGAYKDFPWK